MDPMTFALIDAGLTYAIRLADLYLSSKSSSDPPTPEQQARLDALDAELTAKVAAVRAYTPLQITEEPTA